jgi:hypothetical protein
MGGKVTRSQSSVNRFANDVVYTMAEENESDATVPLSHSLLYPHDSRKQFCFTCYCTLRAMFDRDVLSVVITHLLLLTPQRDRCALIDLVVIFLDLLFLIFVSVLFLVSVFFYLL